MPTRRPRTQARNSYEPGNATDLEDAVAFPPHQTLSSLILSRTLPLGHTPRDEEEKRIVYEHLIRLKEQRYTHAQCASALQVSERTIANYLVDPLYLEVQSEMIAAAKQRGHLRIAEVIDDAVDTLYTLMQGGKSEFVRYKAAEKLLDVAGYSLPREESHIDSRAGLSQFLAEVEARRAKTVVNIQIQSAQVVEAGESIPSDRTVPADLAHYYQRVLPGGKLPPMVVKEEST